MLIAQREGGLDPCSSSSTSFLQQQQLIHLTQLQNMYSQQATAASMGSSPDISRMSATGGLSSMTAEEVATSALASGRMDSVEALAAAASQGSPRYPEIPGDQAPLCLDPNSLGAGGLDGKSILTPMVNAVAAAVAASGAYSGMSKTPAHFFPPTPIEKTK